jgi:hypothetical protein
MHEAAALAYSAVGLSDGGGGGGGDVHCNGLIKTDDDLPLVIQQHEAAEATVLVPTNGDQEQQTHIINLPDIQELTHGDTIFILCSDGKEEEVGDITQLHNDPNK